MTNPFRHHLALRTVQGAHYVTVNRLIYRFPTYHVLSGPYWRKRSARSARDRIARYFDISDFIERNPDWQDWNGKNHLVNCCFHCWSRFHSPCGLQRHLTSLPEHMVTQIHRS